MKGCVHCISAGGVFPASEGIHVENNYFKHLRRDGLSDGGSIFIEFGVVTYMCIPIYSSSLPTRGKVAAMRYISASIPILICRTLISRSLTLAPVAGPEWESLTLHMMEDPEKPRAELAWISSLWTWAEVGHAMNRYPGSAVHTMGSAGRQFMTKTLVGFWMSTRVRHPKQKNNFRFSSVYASMYDAYLGR